MHLKDQLGDIETDCRNRLHRWLLRIMGTSNGAPYPWHSRAGGGAVHSITRGHRAIGFQLSKAGSATPELIQTAANRRMGSARPLSSARPWSTNLRPAPATRSFTVLEARTSLAFAC